VKRDVRTTRRADRSALALIGALLVAGAVITLLLASGAIDGLGSYLDGDGPLLNGQLDRSLDDNRWWWQLGAFAAGLVLAAVGLVWLRHQLPAGRQLHPTTLDVDDGIPGDTVINGHALANAFEADIRRHPAVLDTRADMLLDSGTVRIRLTTADDTDLRDVLNEAVRPAMTRLTTVAGLDAEPGAQIDVRLRPRTSRPLH
jgi:hypothetical protein